MKVALNWIKTNPITTALIAAIAFFVVYKKCIAGGATSFDFLTTTEQREGFSTCFQNKQIYLNSADPDEVTGNADVNLERLNGKLFIKIQANLPYAQGGVMHTVWGSYHAFLKSSQTGETINLGSLVFSGDRWYRLNTELAGDYSEYDLLEIYRQTEDYKPKLILSGSICAQGNST